MYDHVVALNSPRLIPTGVNRKTERDTAVSSSAMVNSGNSTRPYSMPSGGYSGVGLMSGTGGLRGSGGSLEFDGAPATDSLEPHWLLELCIQVRAGRGGLRVSRWWKCASCGSHCGCL